MANLFSSLGYQFSSLPLLVDPETCRGKTFIVTGSNSGLGLEAVKHLVVQGSERVIMAVRSKQRGQAALMAVETETGKHGIAQVWDLDMSSYKSIIAFVERIEKELERVDAIIENAAGAESNWLVREGFESTLTTNVIGTHLLTVLMMPYLKACGKKFNMQPRISIITSGMAFDKKGDLAKMDISNILQDVNDPTKWSMGGTDRYSLSKLLQIFASRGFAALVPPSQTGVILNLVSPGFCKTGLTRYADLTTRIIIAIARLLFARSAEWGSRNLLHGAVAGTESHGKYLTYCEIKEDLVPAWFTDKEGQLWTTRVWEEVAAELERIQPGCVSRALEG